MFKRELEVPSVDFFQREIPLPNHLKELRAKRIAQICRILSGQDRRLLVIVGPCSAHEEKCVLAFVERLGSLYEKVKDKLLLIPRVYTNKPRSRGVGYKGMFFQPDPDQREDLPRGIRMCRNLLLSVMDASGLAPADEMQPGENFEYTADLIAYTVIGARTSENPQQRMLASGLEIPVGIKNPMSGSVPALLHSLRAVQSPQTFLFRNWQVSTEGNPFAHAILRGRVDFLGRDFPNYRGHTLSLLSEGLAQSSISNPAIIIDANHSNSGKRYREQPRIIEEVLRKRGHSDYRFLKGFMIESFLEEGNQQSNEVFGKSITDPCLSWPDTERLILHLAEM